MNYGGSSYGDYEDSPTYGLDDVIITNTNRGGAPRRKVVLSDCHTGTLYEQHNLNFDVPRLSSVETDVQVLVDDSYCIACVSVKPRHGIKSRLAIHTTNGSPDGGPDTFRLVATGCSYKYYEHVQVIIKIYVVRKRTNRCDPI